MEYPPSSDGTLNCKRNIAGNIAVPVSERIPPDLQARYDQAVNNGTWNDEGETPGGEGLVHFDIDPQNCKYRVQLLQHSYIGTLTKV